MANVKQNPTIISFAINQMSELTINILFPNNQPTTDS